MEILIIINEAPYGNERAWNGFRLATQLRGQSSETTVNVFLMGDAVGCGVRGQKTPDGYYNIAHMIRGFVRTDGNVKCCGTCMDARGIAQENLLNGVERSNMKEFADWVLQADKVINF
jgi:uncharacterized protein involved in oxidation of intracellular sulfur